MAAVRFIVIGFRTVHSFAADTTGQGSETHVSKKTRKTERNQMLHNVWSCMNIGLQGFSDRRAQLYESRYADKVIREDFPGVFRRWEQARKDRQLFQDCNDQWFAGDEKTWSDFVGHVRDRRSLEIGSGPFGYLAPCYWIKERVIIDPLVDYYRQQQLKYFHATFFTDDVQTFNQGADRIVEGLRGTVDGCIVCRNMLDHCEDPLAVLEHISEYAAAGCYFMVWTDLWHMKGLDRGHRNITRSVQAMDKLLSGMDFVIIREGKPTRNPDDFIEYGRILRKR